MLNNQTINPTTSTKTITYDRAKSSRSDHPKIIIDDPQTGITLFSANLMNKGNGRNNGFGLNESLDSYKTRLLEHVIDFVDIANKYPAAFLLAQEAPLQYESQRFFFNHLRALLGTRWEGVYQSMKDNYFGNVIIFNKDEWHFVANVTEELNGKLINQKNRFLACDFQNKQTGQLVRIIGLHQHYMKLDITDIFTLVNSGFNQQTVFLIGDFNTNITGYINPFQNTGIEINVPIGGGNIVLSDTGTPTQNLNAVDGCLIKRSLTQQRQYAPSQQTFHDILAPHSPSDIANKISSFGSFLTLAPQFSYPFPGPFGSFSITLAPQLFRPFPAPSDSYHYPLEIHFNDFNSAKIFFTRLQAYIGKNLICRPNVYYNTGNQSIHIEETFLIKFFELIGYNTKKNTGYLLPLNLIPSAPPLLPGEGEEIIEELFRNALNNYINKKESSIQLKLNDNELCFTFNTPYYSLLDSMSQFFKKEIVYKIDFANNKIIIPTESLPQFLNLICFQDLVGLWCYLSPSQKQKIDEYIPISPEQDSYRKNEDTFRKTGVNFYSFFSHLPDKDKRTSLEDVGFLRNWSPPAL